MSRRALHKVKSFRVDFTTDRYEHLIRRLAEDTEQTLSLVGASRGERGLVSIVMPVYDTRR